MEREKAIEVIKKNYPDSSFTMLREALETLIPELKGSEDMIMVKFIKNQLFNIKKTITENYELDAKLTKAIDWLEKQGEQLENYDEAEKEKTVFVGDGFIECHADFLDFKEGNTYWLSYMGDDKYNVRSDNLLGKTYHITPCQLYTVFKKLTWIEKQNEQKPTHKEPIVVRDFNSVFSREQVEEIDKRIEESQRLYNAKLRDAMRKVEDFPMTH